MRWSTVTMTLALATASVAFLPAASADPTENVDLACPTLPLWDAALCYYNAGIGFAESAGRFVECDVIGGPACGISGQYPGCATMPDPLYNCGITK